MKCFLTIGLLLLSLSAFGQKKGVKVYVMLAEECPISNNMGTPLSNIAADYADKVQLFAVFPLKTSTAATAARFKKVHHLEQYATLLDPMQKLAKKLGAKVTPEVIITSEQGEIMYRGRINDMYAAPGKKNNGPKHRDMIMAIDQALQGKPVPQPWPVAIGCTITYHS